MATLTATAAASGVQPRGGHHGLISRTVDFNSSATEISASATPIRLLKVPHGATIVDLVDYHSSGAATCPVTISIGGTTLLSAATQGAVTRAATGVPYTVSVSDDATTRFQYLLATATPGTGTGSVKISVTVSYTMDK